MLYVKPEIFDYKTVYLLISGVDITMSSAEGEKLYNTLRRAGKISEQHTCIGQMNAFGLLVKKKYVEKKHKATREAKRAIPYNPYCQAINEVFFQFKKKNW